MAEFCWIGIFPWIKLSSNFSVNDYLPLIEKDSPTDMHDLAVYVKEGLSLAWDISLGNYVDSYLYFLLALLDSVSCFFFVWLSPLSLCMVFDALSSNMNELLSIKPSANVFLLEEFNVHHKDWRAYSGETDRSSELL